MNGKQTARFDASNDEELSQLKVEEVLPQALKYGRHHAEAARRAQNTLQCILSEHANAKIKWEFAQRALQQIFAVEEVAQTDWSAILGPKETIPNASLAALVTRCQETGIPANKVQLQNNLDGQELLLSEHHLCFNLIQAFQGYTTAQQESSTFETRINNQQEKIAECEKNMILAKALTEAAHAFMPELQKGSDQQWRANQLAVVKLLYQACPPVDIQNRDGLKGMEARLVSCCQAASAIQREQEIEVILPDTVTQESVAASVKKKLHARFAKACEKDVHLIFCKHLKDILANRELLAVVHKEREVQARLDEEARQVAMEKKRRARIQQEKQEAEKKALIEEGMKKNMESDGPERQDLIKDEAQKKAEALSSKRLATEAETASPKDGQKDLLLGSEKSTGVACNLNKLNESLGVAPALEGNKSTLFDKQAGSSHTDQPLIAPNDSRMSVTQLQSGSENYLPPDEKADASRSAQDNCSAKESSPSPKVDGSKPHTRTDIVQKDIDPSLQDTLRKEVFTEIGNSCQNVQEPGEHNFEINDSCKPSPVFVSSSICKKTMSKESLGPALKTRRSSSLNPLLPSPNFSSDHQFDVSKESKQNEASDMPENKPGSELVPEQKELPVSALGEIQMEVQCWEPHERCRHVDSDQVLKAQTGGFGSEMQDIKDSRTCLPELSQPIVSAKESLEPPKEEQQLRESEGQTSLKAAYDISKQKDAKKQAERAAAKERQIREKNFFKEIRMAREKAEREAKSLQKAQKKRQSLDSHPATEVARPIKKPKPKLGKHSKTGTRHEARLTDLEGKVQKLQAEVQSLQQSGGGSSLERHLPDEEGSNFDTSVRRSQRISVRSGSVSSLRVPTPEPEDIRTRASSRNVSSRSRPTANPQPAVRRKVDGQKRNSVKRPAGLQCSRAIPHHMEEHRSAKRQKLCQAATESPLEPVNHEVAPRHMQRGRMAGHTDEKAFWFKWKARAKDVRFGRSSIHAWGLFARERIEPEEFIIEYVGEIIRKSLSEQREKEYNESGLGSSYLFRLDDDWVVDATMRGGLARYINHSCDPNCYTKIVTVEGQKHIAIASKTVILPGQELMYDYKFPYEEDEEPVPCHCGATNCRRRLN